MILLDYGGLQLRGRPPLAHSNRHGGKKGKGERETDGGKRMKRRNGWPEDSQCHIKKAKWKLGLSTCDKQQSVNISLYSSC